MKNKQSLKLRSAVLLSACVLGFYTVSCSSLHKDKGLPVIGKSVALFDHFNYKGEDDFYELFFAGLEQKENKNLNE